MKKLILLAVVVFGFAATSFAQVHTATLNGGGGNVLPPLAQSPSLNVTGTDFMAFGDIRNVKNGGWVKMDYTGAITKSTGMVAGNTGIPATFKIEGATIAPTITIPTIYFPFNGGKLDILQSQDTYIDEPYGAANSYRVRIGGTVTLYDGATGAFTITGLTVSVNNQ